MSELLNMDKPKEKVMTNLPLLNCFLSTLYFGEKAFKVIYCMSAIKIALDEDNFAVITLKNQQVPYKATILGGFAFTVKTSGTINYRNYFDVAWPDEWAPPEMIFYKRPDKIIREYNKGQKIELGIENILEYHVEYQDGVTANFTRTEPGAYEFSFSTGFCGSFKKEDDGTHSIRFKGLPLDADEGVYTSESKFIISRSKYTNNMVLILQDKATVNLKY